MSSGRRVLLLEDHDDSRELLSSLLRRSGFEVTAYDRCKPAEVHLEAGDMDIALLDVRMPERCGDDFGRDRSAAAQFSLCYSDR
jgi:DNA-binding response OmpR family regulator